MFRVTVSRDGDELAKEMIMSRKDADACMETFLSEEDSILEKAGPGAYVVSLDELLADTWVCHCRKLVVV